MDRNVIKRLSVGHAGIALVIALSTATAIIALRAAVRQNERVASIDHRIALLEHLRADAREIARSARRYLLNGDLKEQQRVFAIEKEMDDERMQLGPAGQLLDRAFDDYVSSIVRSMSADRTEVGAALAGFEDELVRLRTPLGETFERVISRERADRDAARASQRLAGGAQWALLVAGALGLLLTVGGVVIVLRLLRAQFERVRTAETVSERTASSRRELLAASNSLREPLERIMTLSAELTTTTRDEHDFVRLESIAAAASQVDHMLRKLLDVTAIQAGTASLLRERADVATLVDRAIRLQRDSAHHRGIRLRYESQLLLWVYVDRERIVQALGSFIGAAIARARIGAVIVVSANPCDDGVRLLVEDERAQEHSPGLEPVTARPAADLMLHLSQSVIEAHGGRLGPDTAAGGSYSFTLPTEPSLLR